MSAAQLRILLYSATSRRLPGGVQRVMQQLSAALQARGHIAMESWANSGEDKDEDGWVQALRLRDPQRGALGPLSSLAALSKGLRARRPDIVNIHFVTGQALYFLLLARMFGYVTVLSAHGSDLLHPKRGMQRLLPHMLRRADAVTVVSEELRDRALAIGKLDPCAVHVIENGVDAAFWGARPWRPDPTPRLVAVGRLEEVKGFDVLLHAFALLHRRMPQLRLTVVGAGPCERALLGLADRLGVARFVDLPGRLAPEHVRDLLNMAAAFVLPSRTEGLPLALLEAMAAGTPIVATDVGGVADALGGAGALAPPDDPVALAAAVEGFLLSPARAQLASRALKARAERFDCSGTHNAYEALFMNLTRRKAAAGGRRP